MHVAAILVQARTIDSVVRAVRAAYASIGAEEVSAKAASTAHRVVIGKPKSGWSTITDSTYFTVDMGVAAAIATELGHAARVLAVGLRGSGSYGKAASKTFGKWPSKPPTSGKPSALRKVIDKLGKELLPMPWELDKRDGVTLAFDTSSATLTPGPFKSNTPRERVAAEQASQQDAVWWIDNYALNHKYGDVEPVFAGLRTPWGWQTALDSMMHLLFTHSLKLERGSAKIYLQLAEHALDGVTTANFAEKWLITVIDGWHTIRHAVALQCALVAGDETAWNRYVSTVMPAHRETVGVLVWRRTPDAIAKLPTKIRAWLERDFAPRDIFAWAQTTDSDDNLHHAAELAALHGDTETLSRVFTTAATHRRLAARLNASAYSLVHAGEFAASLHLFDRLIALPPDDLTVFANALYAVQSDNSKLPLDRVRSAKYLAAAAPHAEDNPPIYINIAGVEQELGNRERVLAALEAAKRHKLKSELAELRDSAQFKSLRKDPAFVKLVGTAR